MFGRFRKTANDLLLLSRIREWGVHLLVLVVVSMSCYSVTDERLFSYFYFLGLVSLHYGCMLAFCYLLNDRTDRIVDLDQGKKKSSRELSHRQLATILASLLVIGVGAIMYITVSLGIMVLVVLQIIVAIVYSIKPVRLKERGIWGILAAAIIQRVPAFTIFATLISLNVIVYIYICFWLSLLGLIFILEHQIEDWYGDQNLSVKTYVVTIDIDAGRRLRRHVYLAFLLYAVLPGLLHLLSREGPLMNTGFVIWITATSIIATTLLRIRYRRNSRARYQSSLDEERYVRT
ncbi:MAG: UbiA prenyltransferase family protein [Candidatus Zixiibacteriota bacterium]|nr:MAG: UbiA prenyltransferase family protein [candidate division Zixibacteria bacterium]